MSFSDLIESGIISEDAHIVIRFSIELIHYRSYKDVPYRGIMDVVAFYCDFRECQVFIDVPYSSKHDFGMYVEAIFSDYPLIDY